MGIESGDRPMPADGAAYLTDNSLLSEGVLPVKLVPVVYVTDMKRSLSWYRALLPDAELVTTSEYWSEFSFGASASLALHRTDTITAGSQVGVALEADRPLEQLATDLSAAGIALHRNIQEEVFGRSLCVEDPDGLVIQVNEQDAERHQGV